ncbi:MAG: hypothetical protein JW936_09445 [Sedimentisphaerales bacterium]|nr:hypothetical protein [Sedimentisphaerales bacterium]
MRWWLLVILLLGIAGWAAADGQVETGDTQSVVETYGSAEIERVEGFELGGEVVADACTVLDEGSQVDEDASMEEKRGRYKLALMVMLFGIAGLFLMFFLVTLLRISRFHRRRLGLGAKREKTQYIDAWSKYRIKDGMLDDDKGEDDDG